VSTLGLIVGIIPGAMSRLTGFLPILQQNKNGILIDGNIVSTNYQSN
jgi:hypothetical protein